MEYELFYLIAESKRADLDRIQKELETLVVGEGGEMQPGEFIDERRMEYPIKKERRGIYVAKRFTTKEAAGDVPGNLSKKLLLNGDILRFLVVRSEGLPALEESQERVKRVADTRRRAPGRPSSFRPTRPLPSPSVTPAAVAPEKQKPGLSDTEIDKKLGEVLDI